jgi:hypothetical protein
MSDTETLEMIDEDALPGTKAARAEAEWEPRYPGSGRLQGKVALITGADSASAGRSPPCSPAKAPTSPILYLCEHDDAAKTRQIVEAEGRRAIAIAGDVGDKEFCERAVAENRPAARKTRHPRQQCRRAASGRRRSPTSPRSS